MAVPFVLETTEHVIPGLLEDGGFDIAATRYRRAISLVDTKLDAASAVECIALLCIHGISFHKESFLPTIECLFELQSKTKNTPFQTVEAWVLDSPNHGRAAVLNAARLLSRPNGISAHEWGRAGQILLKSGLIHTAKIVAIGHSTGSVISCLTTWGYPLDKLPYSSLILVEPSMLTPKILAHMVANGKKAWHDLIEMAKTRRDVWSSRTAAHEWMSKRLPWKTWSLRSIDLFVEYALYDLPTPTYPDRTTGVTLCCTRAQEAVGYIYHQDAINSTNRLSELCQAIPVHCIFGDRLDIVPEYIKATVVDERQGRKMTTITKIPGTGHLVVMEDPKNIALAIWSALHHGGWMVHLSKL